MALDPTQIAANQVLTPQAITAQNQKLQAGQLANTGAQQGIDAEKIKQASDKLDFSLKTLAQVHDQASFDAWHMNMQKNGVDTNGDPTVYDPNWQKQSLVHGVSMKDQMQIAALSAYRQSQLGLKAITAFGSVDEAAKAGYVPSPQGSGWIPSSMPDINDIGPAPMIGGQNNPPPLPAGNAALDPLKPAQQGPMPSGATMDSLPASSVANTPAGQDPLEVWKAAVAAQGGISPATKPMDAAAIQQQPAAQVAATPMGQMPGETVTHARLRFQQQGGTQDALIQSRMRNTGEDYATAASAIKNGIGQGNTVDANGNVVPRAGSLSAASQQAAAKGEGAGYGKELGAQMEEYRSQSEAAQGMDATLNAMKADAEKFRMGAMSDMQGTAKSYLQALAQGFGVSTPEMDTNLGAQQAFTKSAMGLVMGGMQKVQGRAFGEMKAIQSAFPTQAMSKGGFDLVVNQIEGSNQYAEAKYQAASDYRQKNNSLDGFENEFQKKVSPWAYVVKNMDGAQLTDLRNNLSKTQEGQKELKMLADQIRYAKTHGYMQ